MTLSRVAGSCRLRLRGPDRDLPLAQGKEVIPEAAPSAGDSLPGGQGGQCRVENLPGWRGTCRAPSVGAGRTSVAVFMALLGVTIVNIACRDIRRSFPQG